MLPILRSLGCLIVSGPPFPDQDVKNDAYLSIVLGHSPEPLISGSLPKKGTNRSPPKNSEVSKDKAAGISILLLKLHVSQFYNLLYYLNFCNK